MKGRSANTILLAARPSVVVFFSAKRFRRIYYLTISTTVLFPKSRVLIPQLSILLNAPLAVKLQSLIYSQLFCTLKTRNYSVLTTPPNTTHSNKS